MIVLHLAEGAVTDGTRIQFNLSGEALDGYEVVDGKPTSETFTFGGDSSFSFDVAKEAQDAPELRSYTLRLPGDSGPHFEGEFEKGVCTTCPPPSTFFVLPQLEFYVAPRAGIRGVFNESPARLGAFLEIGSDQFFLRSSSFSAPDGSPFEPGVDVEFELVHGFGIGTRFDTMAITSDDLPIQIGSPARYSLPPATQSASGTAFVQTIDTRGTEPSSDIQHYTISHLALPSWLPEHSFVGIADLQGDTRVELELDVVVDPDNPKRTVTDLEVLIRDAADPTAPRQLIQSTDEFLDRARPTVTFDGLDIPEGAWVFYVRGRNSSGGNLGSDRVRLTVDLTVPQLNAGDTLVTDSDLTDGILDQICITSDERLSGAEFTIEPPRSTFVVDLRNITPTETNGTFTYCVDNLALPGGVGDPNDAFVLTVAGVDVAGNVGDAVLIGIGASGICACLLSGPCTECAPSAVVGQVDQFTPNGVAVPVAGVSVALLVDPLDQPTSLTLQDVSFLEVTPNTGAYRTDGVPMGVFYPIALRGSILQRGEAIVVLPGFEPDASFTLPGATVTLGAVAADAFDGRIDECTTNADCPAIGSENAFLLPTCQGGMCTVALPTDACFDQLCDVSDIKWSGLCTPSSEVCDGIDNDCDGLIDDDPQFDVLPNIVPCLITGFGLETVRGYYACSQPAALRRSFDITNQFGTCSCSEQCLDGAFQSCNPPTPAADVCDGIDNDCDGEIDEAFKIGQPCDGADPDIIKDGTVVCDSPTDVRCDEPPDLPLSADPLASPNNKEGFTHVDNFDPSDGLLDVFWVRTTPHATSFELEFVDPSGATVGTLSLDASAAERKKFLDDGYVVYFYRDLALPGTQAPDFEKAMKLNARVVWPEGITPFPPVETYDFASSECRPGICTDAPLHVRTGFPIRTMCKDTFFPDDDPLLLACKDPLSYVDPALVSAGWFGVIPAFRAYYSFGFDRPSVTVGISGSIREITPTLFDPTDPGWNYAFSEPDHDIYWNSCPDADSAFALNFQNCNHPPVRIDDPATELESSDGVLHMEALYCQIPPDEFRPDPGDLVFDLGEWVVDCGHGAWTEVHSVEVHAIAKRAEENAPARTWRLTAINRRKRLLLVQALLKLTAFEKVCKGLTDFPGSDADCADLNYPFWRPRARILDDEAAFDDGLFAFTDVWAFPKPGTASAEPVAHILIALLPADADHHCRDDPSGDRCSCEGETASVVQATCGGRRFGHICSPVEPPAVVCEEFPCFFDPDSEDCPWLVIDGKCGPGKGSDCNVDDFDAEFTNLRRNIVVEWVLDLPEVAPKVSWF